MHRTEVCLQTSVLICESTLSLLTFNIGKCMFSSYFFVKECIAVIESVHCKIPILYRSRAKIKTIRKHIRSKYLDAFLFPRNYG